MDTVVYDAIEKLQAKADEIKFAVDEFGEMLEDIQTFTNETNLVVKDILNGRQLSEWIADLAASGKESATYADAGRMQALAEDTDACKNVQVSQHIFDWCVTNNKVGTYYNSIFGAVSGVTWNILTTPALAYANASAFSKVANDSTAFTTAMENSISKKAIWNNLNVCDGIIRSSSTALNKLDEMAGSETTIFIPFTKNVFIVSAVIYSSDRFNVNLTCAPNGEQITLSLGQGSQRQVNRFVTKADGSGFTGFNTRYVDFS